MKLSLEARTNLLWSQWSTRGICSYAPKCAGPHVNTRLILLVELWILFFYFLPRKKMLILLEQEWSYSHTLLNCYGSEKVSFKIPVLRLDEFCMSMSLCRHSESVRQSHKEKIFVFSLFCYATYHFCLIHHSNQCRGTTYLVRLGSHFYSSAHF